MNWSRLLIIVLLCNLAAGGRRANHMHELNAQHRRGRTENWRYMDEENIVAQILSGPPLSHTLGSRALNKTSKQLEDCSDVGILSTPENPYGACHAVVHRCHPSNGIVNYLALPYCAMPDRKWLAFTIILIWVLVLCIWIFSIVDFLCPNLVAMTDVCQMRESVAGVTFLAFGHGAPEVFDMVASALLDSNGMAMAIGQVSA